MGAVLSIFSTILPWIASGLTSVWLSFTVAYPSVATFILSTAAKLGIEFLTDAIIKAYGAILDNRFRHFDPEGFAVRFGEGATAATKAAATIRYAQYVENINVAQRALVPHSVRLTLQTLYLVFTAAAFGGLVYGLGAGITGLGRIVASAFYQQPDLIKLDNPAHGLLYTQRTLESEMRVSHREGGNKRLLADEKPRRAKRKRRNVLRSSTKVTTRRSVSNKVKQVRRKNRK